MDQSLSASKYIEQDEVKNSRILNRKQIEKRLQSLKPQQYNKIINNLTSQNDRLQHQVKDLHEKVQQLMIAKKIPINQQKNPLVEQELKRARRQLQLKYESMSYLKQQIRKYKATDVTEDMKNKISENRNEIFSVQQQIKQVSKQKMQLIDIFASNTEAMEEYVPTKTQGRDEKIAQLKQENKQLKKKLLGMNLQGKNHEKNSQQVIDKFYHLKQEEQKYLKALAQSKSSKKKFTMNDVKSMDLSEVSSLKKQVQSLRKQKKDLEKDLVNQKINKQQKKVNLQAQAREMMEVHKQLMQKRMKCLNKLNLYEAKDQQHKQLKELKQMKAEVVMEDRASQTDKIIPKDFRKEWIGKNQGLLFDDSLILDYRSQIAIKAALVYKTVDHIVFIKFFYQTGMKKRYESKVPFDSQVLRKFDSKKHTAPSGCFLNSFKVALTSDKVTKIELIWSNGDSSVEGWSVQGSTLYTADIGPEERPVSMFGSVSYHGKNTYSLECLGCEVNLIENQ